MRKTSESVDLGGIKCYIVIKFTRFEVWYMKLNFTIDKKSVEMQAICEILPMLDCVDVDDGTPVLLKKTEKGLHIYRDDYKGYIIEYSTRVSLIRALGLLCENFENESLNIEEIPKFECLGTMPDSSRNAVLTVDSLKKWLRIKALMGFNAMMLYTEDTYEVNNQPHFGYMRGRYTKNEIKEIDDYADLLGIELVPCIQTLAHLKTLFSWQEYVPLRDVDGILRAEDEDVYKLIDDMLDSCVQNFRSRKINLGMDEAFLLGSGTYMGKNGYKPRPEIMKTHLAVLVEKCKARGLEPMIWGDMFFRMLSPKNVYYNMELERIPQETLDIVPKGLKLLYWDYYSINKKRYDHMFDLHADFVNNETGFAGGAVCWYGVVPLNAFSVDSARVATQSAIEKGCKEAWITMWGDDASACAHFATVPTLQIYAEACWSGDTSDEYAEKRMKTCAGGCYSDFLEMEQINNVPLREDFRKDIANPYKYMLYQDILSGKYDRHIPDGISKHFADNARRMESLAKNNPEYFEIFNTLTKLCEVLEIKADLGVKLKAAYDANDKDTLREYADSKIPELIRRIEAYYIAMRAQWNKYNKPEGFEIQDIRFGSLIQRAKNVVLTLSEYLENKTNAIPELETKRIPYDSENDGKAIRHVHYWQDIVTVNVVSKHST